MRTYVLLMLSSIGVGVWLATQGKADMLEDVVLLLLIGSAIAYLNQTIADASGAFSRIRLLNTIIYLYSLLWIPTIGLFILSRLWVWEINEAGLALLVGSIFWLMGYSTRQRRLQREQEEHAA